MISYDLKSLFTSASLEETMTVTLGRIYNWKEVDKTISKNAMGNLLLLCTKNVLATYIYGFPLRFCSSWYFYGAVGDENNTNGY